MKNHLSMELSIFSGASSWWGGSWGSWSGLTRLGDSLTAVLVLAQVSTGRGPCSFRRFMCGGDSQREAARGRLAGDQALPGLTTLVDNIHGVAGSSLVTNGSKIWGGVSHFLFLHSPVKANWFSGLPSGIL